MSDPDETKRLILATSGGSFGEPRGTYFDCDLADDADRYPTATLDFDRYLVQASSSEAPSVLCIMTATDARLKNVPMFEVALQARFDRVGASAHMMMVTYYSPGDRELQASIEAADIVYVSGGTSHLLNATLRRRRVDTLLAAAAERGAVLSGLSAGLCCWFSHINSSLAPQQVATTDGLGWFNALVAPHWDIEPTRHKPFHQALLDNPGLVGLAFDEHTAIEIRGDRFKLHQFAAGGQVRRGHYCETSGDYSFEPVEVCAELMPLSSLGITARRVG